ncbi:MAG: TatD family hydrolase [Spirochaetales bacterium]|nr:TatD family hydrolase [Spirochaetales bacterium]
MIDSHAHAMDRLFSNAFVCTASIPSKEEAETLKGYLFHGVGKLPFTENIENLELLEGYLKDGFHLGEVGLDRRYFDVDRQEEILNTLLDIALPLDKCVVFHSVGHTERLLRIIRERKIKRFIIHGYTGSYETAKTILSLGGLISISERLEKAKSFEKIITLPFVTESDMNTGIDAEMSLKRWNSKLSSLLEKDIERESQRVLLEYMNG